MKDKNHKVVLQQIIIIKLHVKRRKSFTKIYNYLHKVYGDKGLAKRLVSKWMKRFCDGREVVKYDGSSECSMDVSMERNVSEVGPIVMKVRETTI